MGNFKQNDFYVSLRNTQNKWEQKPSLLHSKSLLWQPSKWTMKNIPVLAHPSQMGDFRALQWHFIATCTKFIDLSFPSWTIKDGWTMKSKALFHSININVANSFFFLVQRLCVPVLSVQIRVQCYSDLLFTSFQVAMIENKHFYEYILLYPPVFPSIPLPWLTQLFLHLHNPDANWLTCTN